MSPPSDTTQYSSDPRDSDHVYKDGVLQPSDAAPETLTETEWKAILDAMLLTEEQCPLVSDAHFAAKEKVRAAISYPTARGLFAHPEDAPRGPWALRQSLTSGSTWDVVKNEGTIGYHLAFNGLKSEAIAVRDALNRVDRLKGEET